MNAGLLFIGLLVLGMLAPAQQTSPPPTPSYHIAGVVVNSLTGQPIANASVAIAAVTSQGAERDISHAVTTGSDGRFSFAGLAPGKYSLMAEARGYSLQYFEHHDAYSSAIVLGPNLDADNLVFRLQLDASIEGHVSDENNEPVGNAMVRLFERRVQDGRVKTLPLNQAQTDDNGHFHMGHLSAGTYYLAVSARPWYAQNSRFAPARSGQNQDASAAALDVTYPLTFYPDATDSAAATPISLQPGERETTDIVLRAVPALHLRIRTGAPKPDSSAGVSAVMGGGSTFVFISSSPRISQRLFQGYLDPVFNAPASTPEPGVTEISGLAPGHYVLEMQGSSGAGGTETRRSWYQELDLTGDTELTAGQASTLASLSGSIVFEGAGRPPRGSAIRLAQQESGEIFHAEVSDKGQFEFHGNDIRPGRYDLVLENAQGFFLKRIGASGARVFGRTLEITGSSNVRIVAEAARGVAQVTGVALREGQPFPGAMIVLVPQQPADNTPLFRRDQSDSDGTFVLSNVVPGHYTALAIVNGWDLEWSNPAVLQPYMKIGTPVEITGDGKVEIKVQVQ